MFHSGAQGEVCEKEPPTDQGQGVVQCMNVHVCAFVCVHMFSACEIINTSCIWLADSLNIAALLFAVHVYPPPPHLA